MPVSAELIQAAERLFDFVRDTDGKPYAVPVIEHASGNWSRSTLAIPLGATGSSIRGHLTDDYYNTRGKVPGRNAVSEACEALVHQARHGGYVEPVHLRHGRRTTNARYIDLGDDRVAVIIGGGWHVSTCAEVLFRRTALHAPFPTPAEDVDWAEIERAREVFSIGDDAWHLLVGWMVAVLLADVPVPIVQLSGEQGTGKTTTARRIVAMTDPSTVPVRSAPRDVEAWVVSAAGSRVVCLDNLSSVGEWLSDALCRAVTGDGLVRRALYTDEDLVATSHRRAIILTTIDAGAIRGDLGERLLPIELERIDESDRRTEAELSARFEELAPTIIGALFQLTGEVIYELVYGTEQPDRLPRMADFGRVLHALDEVTGWATLPAYVEAVRSTMTDVVNGDALAQAVAAIALRGDGWRGTSSDLLTLLRQHRPDDNRAPWPTTPKGLTGALKRHTTALRVVGVDVRHERTRDARFIHLHRLDGAGGDGS